MNVIYIYGGSHNPSKCNFKLGGHIFEKCFQLQARINIMERT